MVIQAQHTARTSPYGQVEATTGRWRVRVSGNDVVKNIPMHIGEAHITAAEAVGGLLVVKPQHVKHGGMHIVQVALILNGCLLYTSDAAGE